MIRLFLKSIHISLKKLFYEKGHYRFAAFYNDYYFFSTKEIQPTGKKCKNNFHVN